MKKLKCINDISTFGIIAPASSNDKETIDKNIDNFKKLGYKIKISNTIYKSYGYLAGSDKERALSLNEMFKDKDVDAIICYRGGYGSIRMAPYLDLKVIKANPKPFIGYSDITLLLNYINKRCGFVTFHGPMINSNFNDKLTKDYFINILKNNNFPITYNLNELIENNIVYNIRDFSGKIVGGNLSLIVSTLSTPYEINFKDNILFIEEINESLYAVDRMLSQLISCGKLKNVCGIIIGQFTNCKDEETSFDINHIIKEKLEKLKIPLIIGFPAGHDYPNIILPIGANFTYISSKNILIQNKKF